MWVLSHCCGCSVAAAAAGPGPGDRTKVKGVASVLSQIDVTEVEEVGNANNHGNGDIL